MIHLTPAADARLRGGLERMRQADPSMVIVLMEHGDVGIEAPTRVKKKTRSRKPTMVRFAGPWVALCGYADTHSVTGWLRIRLFGEEVFLLPSLAKRLRTHLIDERTVCDPVSGLSQCGLFLRKP